MQLFAAICWLLCCSCLLQGFVQHAHTARYRLQVRVDEQLVRMSSRSIKLVMPPKLAAAVCKLFWLLLHAGVCAASWRSVPALRSVRTTERIQVGTLMSKNILASILATCFGICPSCCCCNCMHRVCAACPHSQVQAAWHLTASSHANRQAYVH
jgi:hypothetical protein